LKSGSLPIPPAFSAGLTRVDGGHLSAFPSINCFELAFCRAIFSSEGFTSLTGQTSLQVAPIVIALFSNLIGYLLCFPQRQL
jgi:hypothetical protein